MLGVVSSCTNIFPQIDFPEAGTIQFVCMEMNIACVSGLGIVFGITRIPFYD